MILCFGSILGILVILEVFDHFSGLGDTLVVLEFYGVILVILGVFWSF